MPTKIKTKQIIKDNAVTKSASDIFKKIQKKTGIDNKKIDAFQKSWLAMPEKKKKYEHLADAPQVVGEELIGMTNDIINFIQGEETGKSEIFQKLKKETGQFIHHSVDFLKNKYTKGKKIAVDSKQKALKTNQAQKLAKKTKQSIKK